MKLLWEIWCYESVIAMEKFVVIDITKYKTVHDDVTIFFEQRWALPFRRLLGISVGLSLYIIWIFVVICRKDFCERLQKLYNNCYPFSICH